MKASIKILILLGTLVIFGAVYYFGFYEQHEIVQEKEETSISFEKHTLDCARNPVSNHSIVGGAVIDIDDDGVKEFFITGGREQKDCLFRYEDGALVNIIDRVGIKNTEASYGAFSVDTNNDRLTDLFVARESGIYLYINMDGVFEEKLIYASKKDSTGFFMDIALSDSDNDGDLDIYISTFEKYKFFESANFNDTRTKQNNIFLENVGDMVFQDVTKDAGLTFKENTFSSTFVDLNNDNLEDLVLILNTNKTHIYKNLGNNKFELATVLGDYGFWMGLAVADVNNDGDVDLFFSNIGSTISSRFARGNLRDEQKLVSEFALWENTGDFTFTNSLPDISTDDFGFGWGIIPLDLNFDNKKDFIIRQNYVSYPPHRLTKLPGSALLNLDGRLVETIDEIGLSSKVYGFTALVGDFDGDERDDVVDLNLKGAHAFYKNVSTTDKQKISVDLPMTSEYTNAKAELFFKDGTSIKRSLNRKQGICSVQDSRVTFYFSDKKPSEIHIFSKEGKMDKIKRLNSKKSLYRL